MAYTNETSSVKTIVPGAEVSGFCDVVAREKIATLSGEVPQLSGGEGVQLVNEDGKTRIDLGLSAGSNMSFVYDQETNTIRLDSEGATYSGIAPIVVNNTTNQISADTWLFSAGNGISFVDDNENKVTRIDVNENFSNYYTKTETSSKQEISAAINNINTDIQYVSANAGKTYTGVAPIQVNNTTNEISITGESLAAGPNIDIFSSGGYVVISANGGGGGGSQYTGISPIDVNNTTHEISAKGVSFGVQSPLFFVQDDNEAVVIGCSAGGGITYTGDAQGALDEVYTNSGVWLTSHQSLTNYYTKTETSSKQEISAALTGYQTKLDGVNNIVYTASLPASPDANTLYLIPEA